jgi:hypothetical protein
MGSLNFNFYGYFSCLRVNLGDNSVYAPFKKDPNYCRTGLIEKPYALDADHCCAYPLKLRL